MRTYLHFRTYFSYLLIAIIFFFGGLFTTKFSFKKELQWSAFIESPQATKGESEISATWNEAMSYCDSLDQNGYSDWRLPTYLEIVRASIEPSATHPDDSVFGEYWSATLENFTDSSTPDFAYAVDLAYGNGKSEKTTEKLNFRCVR